MLEPVAQVSTACWAKFWDDWQSWGPKSSIVYSIPLTILYSVGKYCTCVCLDASVSFSPEFASCATAYQQGLHTVIEVFENLFRHLFCIGWKTYYRLSSERFGRICSGVLSNDYKLFCLRQYKCFRHLLTYTHTRIPFLSLLSKNTFHSSYQETSKGTAMKWNNTSV